MVRFYAPAALMIVHLIISGCSSRQQVDLAQWREYRGATATMTAEESPRPAKVRTSSAQAPSSEAKNSRANVAPDEVESVGTLGQITKSVDDPKHMRPWPKRGSPEFEQLQAEEIEQENRVKDAIQSLCRYC